MDIIPPVHFTVKLSPQCYVCTSGSRCGSILLSLSLLLCFLAFVLLVIAGDIELNPVSLIYPEPSQPVMTSLLSKGGLLC